MSARLIKQLAKICRNNGSISTNEESAKGYIKQGCILLFIYNLRSYGKLRIKFTRIASG